MRDRYPVGTTCPRDHLVPLEFQPDYTPFDRPQIEADCNVGDHLADRHVRAGQGALIAAIHAESGHRLTYATLAATSSLLAAGLVRDGVAVGDRVAYCGPNHPDLLVIMVAIWKAGGIVVPIPAHARTTELAGYFEDSGVSCAFIHRSLPRFDDIAGLARGLGARRIVAFGDGEGGASELGIEELMIDGYAGPRAGGDHVAIVWHTGGTTGRPKGCYHTHRRFLSGGYALAEATGAGPGQRWAAAAPMGHALGLIFNTIYTVMHGATVVIIEHFTDLAVVLRAIERHRITTMAALMASWAKLADLLRTGPGGDVSSLRRCFAMWQSASASEVYDFWQERGIELANNFGSTSFATWILVPALGEATPRAALGRPPPGYVVEAVEVQSGKVTLLPHGSIGQMAVKGPTGLTYWNLPERQRQDVVEGWTLSDDLIRLDERGIVHYLGRSDSMISTSGFKVAPVEVENALSRHPAVAEVAVVPAPSATRFEIVVAYISLNPGYEPDDALRASLHDFVKSDISSYKIPRRIEFVRSLPRDPLGKIQVKVLKEWLSRAEPPE